MHGSKVKKRGVPYRLRGVGCFFLLLGAVTRIFVNVDAHVLQTVVLAFNDLKENVSPSDPIALEMPITFSRMRLYSVQPKNMATHEP